MVRGIGWLAKDLKREIEKARADAGPIIIQALVEDGPWWTGTFGRSWELSDQPLKPTEKREGDWRDSNMPTSRIPPNVAALKLPLNSPLYIGNTVEYAGFAVNNPNATSTPASRSTTPMPPVRARLTKNTGRYSNSQPRHEIPTGSTSTPLTTKTPRSLKI
jgi:hypothetical protein